VDILMDALREQGVEDPSDQALNMPTAPMPRS